MQISRRQFSITVIMGVLALLLSRFLSIFSRSGWDKSKKDESSGIADAPVARHWRRGDHLAG